MSRADRLLALVLAIAVGLGLVGCGGGDDRGTGQVRGACAGVGTAAPTPRRAAGHPELRWCAAVGGWVVEITAACAGVALAVAQPDPYSSDVLVWAFDAATGAERWRFRAPAADGEVVGSPAVGEGGVFVSVARGNPYQHEDLGPAALYVLDAATGAVRWRFASGGPQIEPSSPLVIGGTVLAVGGDGTLHAVDAAAGTERWQQAVTQSPNLSDAGDGRIAVVERYRLRIFDAASGDLVWAADTPDGRGGSRRRGRGHRLPGPGAGGDRGAGGRGGRRHGHGRRALAGGGCQRDRTRRRPELAW